jgi:hypothetical protein
MLVILLLVVLCIAVNGFVMQAAHRGVKPLHSLPADIVSKLDDIVASNKAMSNNNELAATVDSKTADIIEKYNTYKEIKKMMIKLRLMWTNEASERRKAKQLKSFVELYKGRLDIEEIIKDKLGYTLNKGNDKIPELELVSKWDSEIAKLQGKLKEVEIQMPTGMSTKDERFGLN